MNTLLTQDAVTPPQDSTRLIPLTQGKVAIVDAADFEWLSQWKWSAYQSESGGWYAQTWNGKGKITMHRLILGAVVGEEVDHWDRNGLHNWRSNLRLATRSQNVANCGPRKNSRSGYKGVYWHKGKRMWAAVIHVSGKTVHLGRFRDQNAAATAYNEAALEYFGAFAWLNEIRG